MKIKLDMETCCDVCNEIIHNHIEKCPICGVNTPTEQYHELDHDEIVICEYCHTSFKPVKNESWFQREGTEVEIIK